MSSISVRFLLACVLLTLNSCGGKSHVDASQLGNQAGSDNLGGAGNAGGTGNAGGAGNAGSHAAGAAAAGTGAGGQPAICASFVDAKPLSVPVLIRNDLKVGIHLGTRMETCAEQPLFLVRDASGKTLAAPGPCRTECGTLLAGNPIGGCPAVCALSKAITLSPGESIELDWAGLSDVEDDVPTECVPERSDGLAFGTRCSHAVAVPSGAVTFSVEAGTKLDCSSVLPSGCEGCAPNAAGGCTTSYALVAGSALTARVTVELDAASGNEGVELVFEE